MTNIDICLQVNTFFMHPFSCAASMVAIEP